MILSSLSFITIIIISTVINAETGLFPFKEISEKYGIVEYERIHVTYKPKNEVDKCIMNVMDCSRTCERNTPVSVPVVNHCIQNTKGAAVNSVCICGAKNVDWALDNWHVESCEKFFASSFFWISPVIRVCSFYGSMSYVKDMMVPSDGYRSFVYTDASLGYDNLFIYDLNQICSKYRQECDTKCFGSGGISEFGCEQSKPLHIPKMIHDGTLLKHEDITSVVCECRGKYSGWQLDSYGRWIKRFQ